MTKELSEKIEKYTGLIYAAIREVNELHYDSIVDPAWKKAIGDYHRLESTLMRLGILLEDIVAMFKFLNKGK